MIKKRGMEDCFLACVDGLQGVPEAIEAVCPKTQGQRCIGQKGRQSPKYVPWKERKAVAAALRVLYGAATLVEAEPAVERCAERWAGQSPTISPSGLADWDRLKVFLDYPPAIRRVIATTNALASLHYSLRKRLTTRGPFPNDASIIQGLSLALQNVAQKWTRPMRDWQTALNQCVIWFGERVPV